MKPLYESVGEGVFAVDTEHPRPRADASHLLVDGGRAVFVDTGTYFSIPNLLAALAAQDLGLSDVDYVILTHIHLDHAGGAGRLAAVLPRAQVLVHPRGIAHLVDPTRLIAATKAVYGEARFSREYGDIMGIDPERMVAAEEGMRVTVGRRTLQFIHTPGHALHHVCVMDLDAAEAFTGDTFGVSYREFDTAAGEFILPTTSPTQFDPDQLHASINRILEFAPRAAYLTHYSRVSNLPHLAVELHADIDAYAAIARKAADAHDRIEYMQRLLWEQMAARLARHGVRDDARLRALLDGDVALNAAGLDAWLSRNTA